MAEGRFVKAAGAGSYAEAEQMVDFLKRSGISAYRQGGIMDVYSGNSAPEEDIMVPEQDREAAREILTQFRPIQVNQSFGSRPLSRTQKIISWVVAAVVILWIVVPIVLVFL